MKPMMRCLVVVLTIFTMLNAQWVQTNGPNEGDVRTFVVKESIIYASTLDRSLYFSKNHGNSWTKINSDLALKCNNPATSEKIRKIVVVGSKFMAATHSGVFISTNNGLNWNAVNSGLTNTEVNTINVIGANIFVGTSSGVFLSTNEGANWTSVSKGIENLYVQTISVYGTNIFAGTVNYYDHIRTGGVFLSTDNGTSWTTINDGLPNSHSDVLKIDGPSVLLEDGTNLFAGTPEHGVYLSTNNGKNWNEINVGLINLKIQALAINGSNLFAGTAGGGVFLSTNKGATWTSVNAGLTNKYVIRFCVFDNNIFTATDIGLFLSTNNGTSWNNVNTGLGGFVGIDNLVVNGSNIFAVTTYRGIFLSTNNGTSWTTSSDFTDVTVLTVNGSNLLAGTSSNGLFLSTDNGNNWTSSNSGIPKNNLWNPPFYSIVTACAFKPNGIGTNDVFVGTVIVASSPGRTVMFDQRLYRSTNNGANWSVIDSGFTNNLTTLLIDGTNILAGTGDILGDDWGYGVLLSTDNGNNWTTINSGLPNSHSSHDTTHYSNINALIKNNSRLFAGTNYGIYMSSNSGINWTKSFDTVVTTTFAASGNNLFAGTNNGVFLSTNNGESWSAVNTGIPKYSYDTARYAVNTLTVSGTNLFAGTDNGVWRRPLSEMIPTMVEQSTSPLPETFSLSQNYPNPFNPSTVISYQLPVNSMVSLKIYDLLGREIATLVNEEQSAGWKEVEWNAKDVSSGFYFYQLKAGDFQETKRMILIK